AAELARLALQNHRRAAQLTDRHLERDARARGRLLEDHRQRLAGARLGRAVRRLAALVRETEIEDVAQGRRIESIEVEEMADFAPGRGHCAASAGGLCTQRRATSSMMPIASSTWLSSMMSGGTKRT